MCGSVEPEDREAERKAEREASGDEFSKLPEDVDLERRGLIALTRSKVEEIERRAWAIVARSDRVRQELRGVEDVIRRIGPELKALQAEYEGLKKAAREASPE